MPLKNNGICVQQKLLHHSLKIMTNYLLLKRSDTVKTMKGLWAGVSGIIENR